MTVSQLMSRWRSDPGIAPSIQVWHEIEARQPQFTTIPEDLHPGLAAALKNQGIENLYIHQAASISLVQQGKNLVVVTGTASGKTLCYNLPILNSLLRDIQSRALYLFPTKALAQDQAAALRSLIAAIPKPDAADQPMPSLAIYDGDTPSHARPSIRASTRLLFSNPDMLHIGILPHHTQWAEFFSQLRLVVLDEAHIYRGVFGSHVANVIRRLRRIARFYGSNPQFILTSATIANPEQLAYRLTGCDMDLIHEDGSGRGPKTFLVYNPPVVDPELGLRRSALQESVRLAQDMLTYKVQAIIFGRSRRTVELMLSYLRQGGGPPGVAPFSFDRTSRPGNSREESGLSTLRGYRSGYLPEQRREIERGLRQGQVRVVVATNALELGIDIGGMGAVLMVGYPGTIASTWQQAGRAGRGAELSLAVLVATADPLDQFLAAHPDYLFGRSPEQALVNPDNPLILLDHLRCAAFELPFHEGELFGDVDPVELGEYLLFLSEQGILHHSGSKYFWMADQYPGQQISLRSAGSNPIQLQVWEQDSYQTIGQVDRTSAHWMVHPNAVYLHEAETYLVEELNLEANTARLRRADVDYYTLPRRDTTVALVELHQTEQVAGGSRSEGEIQVTNQVTGFKRVRWQTHETIGVEPLDMPPVDLLTTGYWLALSEQTVSMLQETGLWNNQPNNYGPNWEVQRERARQRDGFRCQVCGTLESGRSHHVHHRTPFRMFTSYIHANVLENLVTLCPDCHRRVEAAVRVRSGLAGLASVLGNLAPFFLMCDTADLGVHSDPQSSLAGGMPAVVIFDQAPAGLGFSRSLYEMHSELVKRAFELVSSCACSDGCPSCTGPGGEFGAGGKQETLAILQVLNGGSVIPDRSL